MNLQQALNVLHITDILRNPEFRQITFQRYTDEELAALSLDVRVAKMIGIYIFSQGMTPDIKYNEEVWATQYCSRVTNLQRILRGSSEYTVHNFLRFVMVFAIIKLVHPPEQGVMTLKLADVSFHLGRNKTLLLAIVMERILTIGNAAGVQSRYAIKLQEDKDLLKCLFNLCKLYLSSTQLSTIKSDLVAEAAELAKLKKGTPGSTKKSTTPE